ncbi:MAG: hypothetical protein AAB353_07065 [Candidatus Hydrogenedentota bacterium]
MRRENLYFAAAAAILTALGSLQGSHIGALRDSEAFYRWLESASTQARLPGGLEMLDPARSSEPQDQELFDAIATLAETEIPLDPEQDPTEDIAKDGQPYPKLVRLTRLQESDAIWDFARGEAVANLREQFVEFQDKGLLVSGGTQFETSEIYSRGTDQQVFGVGVTSLFFGFRKVAANFLWLQVDKFFHQGQMHRMVPIMRSCVTLDPHFIEAYLLGAWHLAYNIPAKLSATPEPQKEFNERWKARVGPRESWFYVGADFLKDGIRKNPRDWRIYFDLGYGIYDEKLQDYPNAILYLREARRYRHRSWVPRRLAMAYMFNGEYEESLQVWEEYLETDPGNLNVPRLMETDRGFLSEAIYREAQECAEAARARYIESSKQALEARNVGQVDTAAKHEAAAKEAYAVVEEMEARAEVEKAAAIGIWQQLWQNEQDPLSQSRIQWFRADELRRQGPRDQSKYYEAIAELDVARYNYSRLFDAISDDIIAIKQEAGIDLTVSETLAVQRDKEAAKYLEEKPKRPRLDCPYASVAKTEGAAAVS